MVRSTDHLNMSVAVDWYVKPQAKQNKFYFEPGPPAPLTKNFHDLRMAAIPSWQMAYPE